MQLRRGSILRVCNEVLEIGIRLLLKIICFVLGFATATIVHGSSADFTGSIFFLIGTLGAFAALRPLAYLVFPALKQSDLRRLRRGPNSKTLIALAIVILLELIFLESVWLGSAMLVLVAAGVLAAAIIRISNPIDPRRSSTRV